MRRLIGCAVLVVALAMALAAPAGANTRTVERIPWTVTFGADVTCTGEAITVTGESRVVTILGSGDRLFDHMTGHVLGTGIGLTTGDPYLFTWTQAVTSPDAPGAYAYTEVYHTSLRHLGPDEGVTADFFAGLVMHYTVVDGRTVVSHEVGYAECR